jgi:hypothetical protein
MAFLGPKAIVCGYVQTVKQNILVVLVCVNAYQRMGKDNAIPPLSRTASNQPTSSSLYCGCAITV